MLNAAHQMTQDCLDPSYLSRAEELHKLLGVVLREDWAGDVRGLEKTEVGHDLGEGGRATGVS